jgi:hypothetical protein
MAYKFSYGVQVRRTTLLNHRKRLPSNLRPGYAVKRGIRRVSKHHPDGGLPRANALPREKDLRLPPSPLAHRLGLLMRKQPSRHLRSRRALLGALLLHHWRFLAHRHG